MDLFDPLILLSTHYPFKNGYGHCCINAKRITDCRLGDQLPLSRRKALVHVHVFGFPEPNHNGFVE